MSANQEQALIDLRLKIRETAEAKHYNPSESVLDTWVVKLAKFRPSVISRALDELLEMDMYVGAFLPWVLNRCRTIVDAEYRRERSKKYICSPDRRKKLENRKPRPVPDDVRKENEVMRVHCILKWSQKLGVEPELTPEEWEIAERIHETEDLPEPNSVEASRSAAIQRLVDGGPG